MNQPISTKEQLGRMSTIAVFNKLMETLSLAACLNDELDKRKKCLNDILGDERKLAAKHNRESFN